jgi:hypothetical protein
VDRQIDNSGRIAFRCPNCGGKLTMPKAHAGKRGRCPKCKQTVTVPAAPGRTSATTPSDADATAGKPALYDLRLLDIPPADVGSPASPGQSDAAIAYEQFRAMQGGRLPGQETETPRRKLPWVIDIFLYPMNRAGMSILLISVGVPFLLRVGVRFFFYSMAAFGPLFIFWVLSIVIHWGAFLMAVLYANWYFCECVRDSAEGGIRAADTTANTPGLGEILGQALKVITSVLVCMAPALIYLNHARSADDIFRVLYAAGGFLIPMAVLAMAMFDALHALNPVMLLGSILKTSFQYCALAAFCYVSCLLVPMAGYCYIVRSEFWILGSALLLVAFYQLLILAHLLGRFYWRNEDKLNWDA